MMGSFLLLLLTPYKINKKWSLSAPSGGLCYKLLSIISWSYLMLYMFKKNSHSTNFLILRHLNINFLKQT